MLLENMGFEKCKVSMHHRLSDMLDTSMKLPTDPVMGLTRGVFAFALWIWPLLWYSCSA